MSQRETESKQGDWPTIQAPGTLPKLDSIFDVSAKFLGELMTFIAQNPPPIPISQVTGYSQTVPQRATVAASETTTSTTYTDLTTAGPSLTGLPDGKYLVIVQALAKNGTSGNLAHMSPSVNGGTPLDADAATAPIDSVSQGWTVAGVSVQTLNAGGNNSIVAKYRSNGGATGGAWQRRNLIAIRMANL